MNLKTFIIFTLDHQHYALSVNAVKSVIRSVKLTHLKDGPEFVHGLLNLGGTFVPVIDIREQFGLPSRSLRVLDRIIIAEASGYTVAFIADSIADVVTLEKKPLDQSVEIYPEMKKFLSGIARHNEQTILIYDIDTLFPEQTVKQIADELEQIEESA